jgi:hypothetical protein
LDGFTGNPLALRPHFDHKGFMQRLFPLLLGGIAVASCVGPPPAPQPVAVPKPQPKTVAPAPQPPAVTQPAGHWLDWPAAPGSWVYRRDDRGSIALYGPAGADALVTLRCDKGRNSLFLSRAGSAGGQLTVRTSSTSKTLAVQPTGGTPAYVAAALTPTDPILDAMAYSRGRIALEVNGTQNVAIPVWSEIGRVIEDCRS